MAGDRVIIIGAGIGGLAAAMLLAARGLDVTVIEKEAAVGGKARRVPVGTVAVDAGPTVFTMKGVFDALFDEAGANLDDHVETRRAGIVARHAWDAGGHLDLYADRAASEAAIGDFAGAAAARGYRAFAIAAARVHDALDSSFMRSTKPWPPQLMWRLGSRRLGDLVALRPYESLWKVLGEYFADPRLRQLFARYATYCGSSPFAAPATLMLVADVEARGVWLIRGGLSALASAMARQAERLGARLRHDSAVTEILTERGRASGVVLGDGERLAADRIICNADPAALADGRFGAAAARAVPGLPSKRRSLSALVWLGVGRPCGFPLATHNVFFSPDYPAEFRALSAGRLADAPTAYLCALDRGFGPDRDGPERFQIIVNAPPTGDLPERSPQEYERCTEQMHARLAASGLTLAPESPPTLVTPREFETLFPSTGGALYGRASHGWAASFLRQSARTRIPGLYCAGGATHPGAGVPMAALSGRLAAATLMRDLGSTARSRPEAMAGGMSTRSATTAASG